MKPQNRSKYCTFFLIFSLVDKNMKLVHEERQFSKNGLAGDLALSSLLDLEDRLLNYARKQVDMKITKEDMVKIRSATHCHICETKFEETDKKCKDHVSRLPLN